MAKQPARKGGPGVRINADIIRTKRIAKGWSQEDLAKESGWSDANMVFRIEKRGTASLESLKKLTDALGISIEEALAPRTTCPSLSLEMVRFPLSLPDFTGREDELTRITTRLRGEGGVVGVSSALQGMGGVGKTVTAIEACWEVKDDFPDGQLVVELRGMSEQPLTPVQAMAQIIRAFHPETDKLPDDEKELLPLYRRVLTGKKALVLLDDAKDEAQVRSLLSVPPVAFIVTSRNTLELDYVESLRLGVLPPDEALTLIRGIIGTKGTDDELRTVAEQCGWLPLALRVAGDFLRLHENWPLPKYIAALKDESKRLERLKGKTPDRDVEAVLGLSARELTRENAELAARWQMLSVFPADFDSSAAAAIWDLKTSEEPDTAEDELTALLERSLVQFDADTDRYSLHDLMRPIARNAFDSVKWYKMQGNTRNRIAAAERRFAHFYCRVIFTANALYLRGNNSILRARKLFESEKINIRAGQAWSVQYKNLNKLATQLCRNYPLNGANICILWLPPLEQIRWLEEAIFACRKMRDESGERTAVGNLGVAWDQYGQTRRAIDFHEQYLVMSRKAGDLTGESAALGHIGLAWTTLGDPHKSLTFHNEHLAIARKIGNRRWEESALGNLGIAWLSLKEANKSISFFEQALAIALEIGDRQGEGLSLASLGRAWGKSGDIQKSLHFLEDALVIAREIGDRRSENDILISINHAQKHINSM
ncbi:tetratricopeptide repeat protein [Gemmata sp. G18]|uniref:Tetratricopeptide repeat protein n=1 Tax=Gemmata palustris TaxID=2822762 RepID=A0ABS5C1L2_9BACT|nr:helix-turn-helix domain-containing protein [Gemmata palustris]MBP3959881.1 tetratricopeptide repeat protein [Gemmata palustris]